MEKTTVNNTNHKRRNTMKKKIALLLASLMLVSTMLCMFSSCKKDAGEAETIKDTVHSNTAEQKEPYNREPEDLGGFVLDVLLLKSGSWNMHTDFAPTEFTGETINKAVYDRNSEISSLYNAEIVAHEDAKDVYSSASVLQTDVLSGDSKYDAAYVQGDDAAWLASDGGVHNLYSIPELQLDENWWSSVLNKECTIGTGKYKTLYFTQSNLYLTAFDLTWCVYFNKSIHESYQVEDLYALVKDGKWTVEKMKTIAASVADDKGEGFTFDTNGTAIYGVTSYWNGAKAMLYGGDPQFIITNSDGDPQSNITNERATNMAQALANFFGKPGSNGVFTYGQEAAAGSSDIGTSEAYKKIFNSERAMFCIAEVKSSVADFKTFKQEFGILPIPKYDEEQSGYRSWVNYLAPVLVIPQTIEGDNLHATALLLDVLSFYSERDVLPEYYDTVLKGRGAQDAESTEMLDIINETRVYDAGVVYGWTSDFISELGKKLLSGDPEVGSLIAKYEPKVQPSIQKTLDAIYKD